jgi:hypothetical protein
MVTGNIQLTTFGFAHVPELPEALVNVRETAAADLQALIRLLNSPSRNRAATNSGFDFWAEALRRSPARSRTAANIGKTRTYVLRRNGASWVRRHFW